MQLVLINVSDHFTRLKANGVDGAPAPTVMGCLLGSQDGRTVDISNSFEIKCDESPENGSFQIDNAFLLKKQEQCEYYTTCRTLLKLLLLKSVTAITHQELQGSWQL